MKVSVIMPVYNGEKYLQEAIDSILNQTFSDFEFIIIDDGSTDNSWNIVQNNAEKDKRIVVVRNEKNLGICLTLNKGLKAAKGQYIARMDCDDISSSDRLAIQVNFMDEHPEYGAIGSDVRIFGENISSPYLFSFDEDWRMCVADMIFSTCMAHPTVMMRANVLFQNGLLYDDNFRAMEDFYMWWQIAKYSKITNIQLPLLNYRHHLNQETNKVHDEIHINKGYKFLNERLNDLKIQISEYQKELILNYIYGGAVYDDSDLEKFILLCKQIILDIRKFRSELVDATKLVMAKAISQSLNNSYDAKKISKSKFYYSSKAYLKGCMPTMWFLKFTVRQIIG